MKKNSIVCSFIFLLSLFLGTACSDNGEEAGTDPGKEELKPVVLPTNLRVEDLTDMRAILTWDGTSTEYEVEMGGEILPTKSISYGLDSLRPETAYSWKVRSREGERYSEWVNGPNFITLALVDYTKGWTGNWEGADFTMALFVLGTEIPVTTFFPEEVLSKKVDVTIARQEGTVDQVTFSIPLLQEISTEFPVELKGQIKNNHLLILNSLTDTLKAALDYPLSLEDLPEEIKEMVDRLIKEIPLVGSMIEDIQVRELGIILEGINLTGQLKKENEMTVKFSVNGKFHLVTNSELANLGLKLLSLNVSLDARMTLYPKQ